MPTLAADLPIDQTYIPTAQGLDPGFYSIEDEVIRVSADKAYERSARGNGQLDVLGPAIARGVAGTTEEIAAHTAGATITAYNPDAPAAAPAGGVANPLTEDLDAGGFNITGASDGASQGAFVSVLAAAGETGGGAVIHGGVSEAAGGSLQLSGGDAGVGGIGGNAALTAGSTDDGGSGAQIIAEGANGATHGQLAIRTNDSIGPGVLVSQGGSLTYAIADAVTPIPDPSTATAEDVANALNALITSLTDAHFMAAGGGGD